MSSSGPMCIRRGKMNKYRIVMDLSDIYEDERTLSFILVDPKWEQVSCLEEHVQNLFDVSNVHFMTEEGFYVPSQESIDIIKGTDMLKVIVPQKWKKKKKKFGIVDGFGDGMRAKESCMELRYSKRRHEDDDVPSTAPILRPIKKRRASMFASVVRSKTDERIIDDTQERRASRVASRVEAAKQAVEQARHNRKRKRSQKKRKPERPSIKEESSQTSRVYDPSSTSTICIPDSMALRESNEDEPLDEPPAKRPFIQLPEISAARICTRRQSEAPWKHEENVASRSQPLNETENKLATLTNPLNGLPSVGDIILFKVAQPDDRNPSDYMCGCCEEVDSIHNTVTCLLLDDLEEFSKLGAGVKFVTGDGMSQSGNLIQLRLDDLLEKRVLKIS